MYCKNCGKEITEGSKFCNNCGSKVNSIDVKQEAPIMQPNENASVIKQNSHSKENRYASSEQMFNQGDKISPNIAFCEDGKYRWIYDVSLLKNPTVFLLLWKIFFFIFIGIFALVIGADIINGYMSGERLMESLKFLAYFLIGMTAVIGLGYLLYAAIMGGKYTVIFEMDENGINHKQIVYQAKKAKKLGAVTAMVGAARGNLTTVGAGLNAQRSEMYSEFSKVRKIKVYHMRNLIKINGLLSHNQVYVKKEDFDFVLNYIISNVPDSAKPKGHQ